MLANVIYWGLPLLALISNSILLLLLSLSKKDKQIRILMVFITIMMIWAASSLLMKMQFFPNVLFWNRVMVTSITLVPYFAYVFVSVFTSQVKVLGLVGWGMVILLITVMNALGYMVTSAEMIQIIQNGNTTYELSYALGPWATFGFGSVFVLLAVCLNKMRKAFKKGDAQRNKLKPVVFGLFVLYVGMILNAIPEVGKYPVDFAFGLVTSGLLFYAIYKSRVVELKIVVTRTVLFTISFSILFGFIALTTNQILRFFDTLNVGVDDQMFLLITTILTIILFMPIFQFMYQKIDNHFYKKQNHQNNLMKDFSISVSNNLNLENITDQLLKVAYEITKNNRIYIFFNNKDNKAFNHYASYKKLDKLTYDFRYSHPFVRWFKKSDDAIFDEYIDNHPFFKTMWDKEVQDLLLMRFQAAIPLKYNNDLIGIVVIGHQNAMVLSQEEVNMMQTLCATASIAINNARMFKKFQNEAILDSLTGLFNHRYFMDHIEAINEKRSDVPTSLIMLNIDMFAMFNDIYGHHAGDNALIKIADSIKFVCGKQGVKCRYGGDIFAILLENCDTNRAYEIAEKIRMRIENMSMSAANEINRHLTISSGISVMPIFAKDDKQLVEQANKALHHSKMSGKNKSVIFNPMHHNIEEMTQDNEEMNMATIYALTAAIDAKDHYTFGHSQRVAKYASAIAEKAGASKEEVNTIHQASLLHDVGKIGIPENILTKFSKLEDHEYETMKMHVDMSITIIKYLPAFNHVIPAVLGHHERWDGKGYPRRIAGENIAFSARCIGIADAFDAITSNRHYKSELSVDYALDEIEKNAGTQFDPYLAKIFVNMVRDGELIIEPSRTYAH